MCPCRYLHYPRAKESVAHNFETPTWDARAIGSIATPYHVGIVALTDTMILLWSSEANRGQNHRHRWSIGAFFGHGGDCCAACRLYNHQGPGFSSTAVSPNTSSSILGMCRRENYFSKFSHASLRNKRISTEYKYPTPFLPTFQIFYQNTIGVQSSSQSFGHNAQDIPILNLICFARRHGTTRPQRQHL